MSEVRFAATTRMESGAAAATPAINKPVRKLRITGGSCRFPRRPRANFPQSAVGEPRGQRYDFVVADDFTDHPQPIQLQGTLLLADPSLRDGVFNRSVILLAEHRADEGAFGLILNHPTGKTVGDFLTAEAFSPLRQLAVHEGGPVSRDQLTFSSFWWSRKLGLRWKLRISAADAVTHARKPGRIVRAFVGYSGWSAGQLENEMRRNSWIPARPQPDLLGQPHDIGLWAELLRMLSPLHRILAEAPDDPSLN